MSQTELETALRKLRLSGMTDALESRLVEARAANMTPIDFLSVLVSGR